MRALRTSLLFIAMAAGVVILGSLAALCWRMVAPVATPAPPEGRCHEIAFNSDGFHSDVIIPAAILRADHPFRRLYPQARTFSVGWGDAGAYRFGNEQPWRHVDAIIPPSESVLHVEADPLLQVQPLAISQEGAERLVAFLDRSARLGPDGGAIVVAPGLAPGRSVFIESPDQFHLFRLCNQWSAEALEAAGLPVSPFGAWTSESVSRQLGGVQACPR